MVGVNVRSRRHRLLVVKGGGFKVELENVTKLRRGRPLGPSMAWEEGGVAAMVRRRTTGMVAVAPALLG
jgi:hypothetical protein